MRATRLLVLGLAWMAGAQAIARDDAEKRKTFCIKRREINAISALDERHAFAKLSAERFYLLTLDKSCRGLEQARTIGLDRSESRICDDGTSLVSFENPGFGAVRCRVERIDKVPDKNAALDLIASRAGPQ